MESFDRSCSASSRSPKLISWGEKPSEFWILFSSSSLSKPFKYGVYLRDGEPEFAIGSTSNGLMPSRETVKYSDVSLFGVKSGTYPTDLAG